MHLGLGMEDWPLQVFLNTQGLKLAAMLEEMEGWLELVRDWQNEGLMLMMMLEQCWMVWCCPMMQEWLC